jgi:hypothetical protein
MDPCSIVVTKKGLNNSLMSTNDQGCSFYKVFDCISEK